MEGQHRIGALCVCLLPRAQGLVVEQPTMAGPGCLPAARCLLLSRLLQLRLLS